MRDGGHSGTASRVFSNCVGQSRVSKVSFADFVRLLLALFRNMMLSGEVAVDDSSGFSEPSDLLTNQSSAPHLVDKVLLSPDLMPCILRTLGLRAVLVGPTCRAWRDADANEHDSAAHGGLPQIACALPEPPALRFASCDGLSTLDCQRRSRA